MCAFRVRERVFARAPRAPLPPPPPHTHTTTPAPLAWPAQNGGKVSYMLHGTVLLTGTVVIDVSGVSGIHCDHCNQVISCSAFEAHAGVCGGEVISCSAFEAHAAGGGPAGL